MSNFFACPPGAPLASLAATHILHHHPDGEAIVLVPTRRACVAMARAFQQALGDRTALLPSIVAFSDLDTAMVPMLGAQVALPLLSKIPPAMPDWQQRYLLARQIAVFEARRNPGGAVRIDQALKLARQLAALQDECSRHQVTLTPQRLVAIGRGGFAQHWALALQFLSILADHWPAVEAELGLTTAAARETAVMQALAQQLTQAAPPAPIYAIGSTASGAATAQLLHAISGLPGGGVVLPGIDSAFTDVEWARVEAGHPLFHLKRFLDEAARTPSQLTPLGHAPRSVWLEALADRKTFGEAKAQPLQGVERVKLVPCAHREEEARAVALLMREGLNQPGRTALITPDETFMELVSAHLRRFGVAADRLRAGTLADNETGSLWQQLLAALMAPQRLLHVRELLHHPLSGVDRAYLREIEPYWHGAALTHSGAMPRLNEALQAHHETARLERLFAQLMRLSQIRLDAASWLNELQALMTMLDVREGSGQQAVAETLAVLTLAPLPAMGIEEFSALVADRLHEAWRDAGLGTHPQLVMLTPVEARLESFGRVILANMTDRHWPGSGGGDAWLNQAARTALGLPESREANSLAAHDLLMLGSGVELFMSWPRREEGAPTTRSRFIERLVTRMAALGFDEAVLTDSRITHWANALDAAHEFTPAAPPMPAPPRSERPARLPVSQLDRLFTDPYSVYAQHVLHLTPLKPIDAEPEPSDFGNLAHRAIQLLSTHWNITSRAATASELDAIAQHALLGFAKLPSIALFWHTRLRLALDFVNAEECKRRVEPGLVVYSEEDERMEAAFALAPDDAAVTLTLHGRIDRLEEGKTRLLADYKTGNIKTVKQILDGHAVQLVAYALLCAAAQRPVAAVEYWQLPRARNAGEILRVYWEDIAQAGVPKALLDGLAQMLDAQTPFLANPDDESAGREYDGISRYDEWAG